MSQCGTNCEIKIWFSNYCGAYAQGETDGWGADFGETRTEAEQKAIAWCNRNLKSGKCSVRISACANDDNAIAAQERQNQQKAAMEKVQLEAARSAASNLSLNIMLR